MKNKTIGIFSKSRVETFSDGIFAIIITLLILEIKPPHIEETFSERDLVIALIKLIPKYISWVISFFTICVIWINHFRLFKMFKNISHGLFWWNAGLLLWVSFIPFPTAVMGDYPHNIAAVAFYGLTMAIMALSFSFMRMYAYKNKESILEAKVDIKKFNKGTTYSILFGPLLYLLGAGLAYISIYLSFLIYSIITIYFIIPHATIEYEES